MPRMNHFQLLVEWNAGGLEIALARARSIVAVVLDHHLAGQIREREHCVDKGAVQVEHDGAGERVIGVTAQRLDGPAVLVGAEETLLDSTDGLVRELVWTWRAEGPGRMVIGPLDARVGERSTTLGAIEVEILAAPGVVSPIIEHDGGLPTPLGYRGGKVPRALGSGEDLIVVAALGDRVELDPKPMGRPQILVYSDRDRPEFRAYRWEGEGGIVRKVRVVRRGTVVLDTEVGPPD